MINRRTFVPEGLAVNLMNGSGLSASGQGRCRIRISGNKATAEAIQCWFLAIQ